MDSAKPGEAPEPIDMSGHSNERDSAPVDSGDGFDAEHAANEIRRHIDHLDAQIAHLRDQRTDLVRQLASVWARL
jgi:predicted outer membrane protein